MDPHKKLVITIRVLAVLLVVMACVLTLTTLKLLVAENTLDGLSDGSHWIKEGNKGKYCIQYRSQ